MKQLGRHLIAELTGCDVKSLNNLKKLRKIMRAAAEVSGATVLRVVSHHFSPQGVSVVVVISESHLSIHTWPEYGHASADFYTCGVTVDPHKGLQLLLEELGAAYAHVQEIARGIPSSAEEKLAHK